MKFHKGLLSLLLLFLLLAAAKPAHAYLDPGTGSMLVQLLLGGVAGALVIVKLYWHRFKAFFGHGKAVESGGEGQRTADGE